MAWPRLESLLPCNNSCDLPCNPSSMCSIPLQPTGKRCLDLRFFTKMIQSYSLPKLSGPQSPESPSPPPDEKSSPLTHRGLTEGRLPSILQTQKQAQPAMVVKSLSEPDLSFILSAEKSSTELDLSRSKEVSAWSRIAVRNRSCRRLLVGSEITFCQNWFTNRLLPVQHLKSSITESASVFKSPRQRTPG